MTSWRVNPATTKTPGGCTTPGVLLSLYLWRVNYFPLPTFSRSRSRRAGVTGCAAVATVAEAADGLRWPRLRRRVSGLATLL